MSAWRTMIRITYEEGKVNLENSRNKHALSRKDGEDNQNSKIKAFDCTPRAAIGWKGKAGEADGKNNSTKTS